MIGNAFFIGNTYDFLKQYRDIAIRYNVVESTTNTSVLYVPKSVVIDASIDLKDCAGEKLVIILGDHASVSLRDKKVVSLFDSYRLIDWYLGKYAQLTMWHDQDYEQTIYETSHMSFYLERESILDYSFLITGALANKLVIDVVLQGERAQATVRGAYVLHQTQNIDITTTQRHCAPHTTSSLNIKGALYDQACSMYRGTIYVDKEARNTNAQQENKNILMSNGARAQSIPALEVLTNDVQCSHGSAVGQFDEDVILYAQTRGLDQMRVRRMLLEGFFMDLFADNDYMQRLQKHIGRRL